MQASAFLKANKAGDSSTCHMQVLNLFKRKTYKAGDSSTRHMQALDLFKRNREREEARDTWSSGGLA